MGKIELSVIVLSYNTRDLLRKCLESIYQFPNTEIIVVDNASSDDSPAMVRKEFPRVRLVCNKENLGFAKGNNIGLSLATGRYILFLNSDTQVKPEAMSEAMKYMEENPKAGALTAKTLLPSGKMDPDCHRGFPTPWASISYFLGLEKLFPKSRLFGQYHKFYLNLNENHEVDAGAGAFMLVRKEVIEKVGQWDENYFFYGEDLDLFFRIKKSGYLTLFYAQPVLTHYKGASSGLRKESRSIAKNSKTNRIKVAKASIEAMEIFYKKFYKNIYPGWLTFIVLLAIKIKGSLRLLKHLLK